jgi:spore coat polysaccharide biosynthesis predicted glycosyltransferase SpsG
METMHDWLFLCDGDERTGLGHVGRCLAYAEMLAVMKKSCVFQGHYQPAAAGMIEAAGFASLHTPGLREDISTNEKSSLAAAEGVLVDSYQINTAALRKLRSRMGERVKLVLIDDFSALSDYPCDAVINFTIGAGKRSYPPGDAALFLGPEFFPARNWLRKVRANRQSRPTATEVRHVLVSPGGSDVNGVITHILSLMMRIQGPLQLGILAGDDESVRHAVDQWRPLLPHNVEVIPKQPNLGHWFDWADVFLCGGGLAKYESLFAGVPVLSLAQNQGQAEDSALLAANGFIADLGVAAEFDLEMALPPLRRFLSDSAWRTDMVRRGLTRIGGPSGNEGLRPFTA